MVLTTYGCMTQLPPASLFCWVVVTKGLSPDEGIVALAAGYLADVVRAWPPSHVVSQPGAVSSAGEGLPAPQLELMDGMATVGLASEANDAQVGKGVKNANGSQIPLTSNAADTGNGRAAESAEVSISSQEMDALLERTLLQALVKRIKDDALPLPAGGFASVRYHTPSCEIQLLHFFLGGRNDAHLSSADHARSSQSIVIITGVLWNSYMLPSRPQSAHLDLKRSSYKKMAKFLQVSLIPMSLLIRL